MPFSQRIQQLAGITVAYALCGLIALHIAIPPGYVAPLYPPAGIALAAMLIKGRRIWPAIFLGAAITNVEAVTRAGLGGINWIMPLCVGTGAVLQAFAGVALIRRWVGFPNSLDSAGSILRFFFVAAPLSCLISASIGVGALSLLGSVPKHDAVFSWWNWWAGDAIGILIACPLIFAFWGQPQRDWAPRRLGLVIPMGTALILLVGLEIQIGQWERQRLQSRFESDAHFISNLLTSRLANYQSVLQSAERVMVAAPDLDDEGFQQFAASWLTRLGGIQAIGWIPRVQGSQRTAFEHAVRSATGVGDFHILDRGAASELYPARDRTEYYPVRFVAPLESNRRVFGVDVSTIPASAEAMQRTSADGQAAASRAFELTQETQGMAGVVLYQRANHRGLPPPASLDGFVFVALRVEESVVSALRGHEIPGIQYCLTENVGGQTVGNHLAGHQSCPLAGAVGTDGLTPWIEPIEFGGQSWTLTLSTDPSYSFRQRGWEAWTLLAIGLLSIGTLGAFLLATTGRARRIEELVDRRTIELADAGRRLIDQQAMLTHAERIAHLGSWEADPANDRNHWSAELYRILGVPTDTPSTLQNFLAAIHPEDRQRLQNTLDSVQQGQSGANLDMRLTSPGRDGRIVHVSIEATPASNGMRTLRGTVQDVSESRAAEAHIHYLAHYDTLTGLPNRSLWINRAEQALAFARRNHTCVGVLFLDLDNFKKVNDTLGHPTGDRLLSAAAKRLSQCLRDEDVLARLGGDEFVVLLPQLSRSEDAATVARKLIDSLLTPFDIDGQDLTVSTSIGIALAPDNGTHVDVLLKHADTAMYDAKNEGRNDFRFFTSEMNSRAYARLMLENALRRAIERNELVLEYQPQWEMPGKRLIGVEALVRWDSPDRGRVLPGEFIPLAEETGLIHAISDWVLHEAARQQAAWRDAGLPELTVAINISALQFRRPGFIDRLRHALTHWNIPPCSIELEITESALMQPSSETEQQFATLSKLGVGLALDDFGTGYSSLSYLKRLPLTRLKIDRSFVQDLPGDPEDAAIATATLSIARDLGLDVVAEGVETEAQCDFLLERQCRVMQGYLLARPQPAANITRLLRSEAERGAVPA
ncbi:MAG: EAL domain-containing protein [Proteobacteria bacterium]|nr:EAL domain-containing protein [Pseudomonadota bacterium]